MALPTALVYAVSPVRTARLGTGAQSRLAADCSGFAASLWCACPFIYTETPPDTAVVALACLVWLLFPVISITDDLNSGQSVFEATSIKKPVQPGDQVRPLLTLLYAAPRLHAP